MSTINSFSFPSRTHRGRHWWVLYLWYFCYVCIQCRRNGQSSNVDIRCRRNGQSYKNLQWQKWQFWQFLSFCKLL